MRSVSLPSFAKINLDLRILGMRADGYHDLRTVFQSLALFDNVTVSLRRGPLTINCDEPDIPTDQRNLVWKAADVLWLFNDARAYHRLVTERGWMPDRFEQWLADSLLALLIRPDYTPSP